MKGKYRITIENRKIKYDFEVKRNLTIIKGDSATGKTILVEMVSDFYHNGEDSGVSLRCSKQCAVLYGKDWELRLNELHESIVFIDEGNYFITTKEFAAAAQKTDNYFVIVTREVLPMLPYSVTEIYGIRDSGKYGSLKQTYNEIYNIYGWVYKKNKLFSPKTLIIEDSGAGFQFFEDICNGEEINCLLSYGKSNIFAQMKKLKDDDPVLIIADGAAFGSEMEKMVSLFCVKKNLCLYLPESFEWLILKAEIVKDNTIRQIVDEPYNFVESAKYSSWEQYFTALLIEKTKGTFLAYKKSTLNSSYLDENIKQRIINQMEGILLKRRSNSYE